MKDATEKVVSAFVPSVVFAAALGITYLMVHWWPRLDWDRALLVQILWISVLSRCRGTK